MDFEAARQSRRLSRKASCLSGLSGIGLSIPTCSIRDPAPATRIGNGWLLSTAGGHQPCSLLAGWAKEPLAQSPMPNAQPRGCAAYPQEDRRDRRGHQDLPPPEFGVSTFDADRNIVAYRGACCRSFLHARGGMPRDQSCHRHSSCDEDFEWLVIFLQSYLHSIRRSQGGGLDG